MSIIKQIYFKLIPMKKYPKYLRKKGMIIGNDCMIYKSASFGSEPFLISLGNHVRINSGVTFITHDGGLWVLRNLDEKFKYSDKFGLIIVKDNVHIGTNAIIMPGITIGNNCIIATGAIVTHDVPDNSVVAGVPAKIIETIDEYKQKNESKIVLTKNMTSEQKKNYLKKIFGL